MQCFSISLCTHWAIYWWFGFFLGRGNLPPIRVASSLICYQSNTVAIKQFHTYKRHRFQTLLHPNSTYLKIHSQRISLVCWIGFSSHFYTIFSCLSLRGCVILISVFRARFINKNIISQNKSKNVAKIIFPRKTIPGSVFLNAFTFELQIFHPSLMTEN